LIRNPVSVPAQQAILAPLVSLTIQAPMCEQWITFLSQVESIFDTLSTGALQNISNIASIIATTLDFLYVSSTQSIYSSQYLLNLAISARQVASYTALSAPISTGVTNLSFIPSAQTALTSLLMWDAVQGYQAPPNPVQAVYTLLMGVGFA
jgi:hypothetical protein